MAKGADDFNEIWVMNFFDGISDINRQSRNQYSAIFGIRIPAMTRLNFPAYEFRFMDKEGKRFIFDPVRKKFVSLTPEEWVRQHVIKYLIIEKKAPETLIKSESEIQLFKTRKRFDVAVFDRNGKALMVVECKAPSIPLSQDVLDQAVRYNLALGVGYLMLTNGMNHIFCHIDPESKAMRLIENLPDYGYFS